MEIYIYIYINIFQTKSSLGGWGNINIFQTKSSLGGC